MNAPDLKSRCFPWLAAAFLAGAGVFGQAPQWWSERGALNSNEANDFGPINQGQLKNLAKAAKEEFDAKLPGGAGSAITSLVAGWTQPSATTNDFAAVNIGQLKAVAKPFYDRLAEINLASGYPWSATTADDNDFGVANIGQAKALFSFEIPWGAGIDPALDSDLDGVPDIVELTTGLNRYLQDTDGDGVIDGHELAEGSDPRLASSNSGALIGLGVWTPLRNLKIVRSAGPSGN